MERVLISMPNSNADDITKAVQGLDIFTKNWCMDCAETQKQNDLVFMCDLCEFRTAHGDCLIKKFAFRHKHNYPMGDFGSMGSF